MLRLELVRHGQQPEGGTLLMGLFPLSRPRTATVMASEHLSAIPRVGQSLRIGGRGRFIMVLHLCPVVCNSCDSHLKGVSTNSVSMESCCQYLSFFFFLKREKGKIACPLNISLGNISKKIWGWEKAGSVAAVTAEI
jgi:hypothetical protein